MSSYLHSVLQFRCCGNWIEAKGCVGPDDCHRLAKQWSPLLLCCAQHECPQPNEALETGYVDKDLENASCSLQSHEPNDRIHLHGRGLYAIGLGKTHRAGCGRSAAGPRISL